MASDIRWDLETIDLARVRREISRLLKPYSMEVDSGKDYRARLCHRRLREVDLTLMEYGGPVAIDAGCVKDFWLLHVPLRGHYFARAGSQTRQVSSGLAHLVHPQMRLVMECSSDCRLLVLRFDDPRLTRAELAVRRHSQAEEFGHILSLEHGSGRSLGRAVDYVARELTQGVLLQQRPQLSPGLEELLLSGLELSLNPDSTATRASSPYYVRRAERYILENLAVDIELDGVVAASGVSARTLFRGFRMVHGKGPIGWARDRRLERARSDLLAATEKLRICDIALRWGFTHLGHFCAAYRARYGQTPSQSLPMRS
jgi:AraC-like DNA-binding protein